MVALLRLRLFLEKNRLLVFDPKALYHIIVKDQHIYEETSTFIEGNRMMFVLAIQRMRYRMRMLLRPGASPTDRSRSWVAEEGEVFRKGTVLLGPAEMEGVYAREELRKEPWLSAHLHVL